MLKALEDFLIPDWLKVLCKGLSIRWMAAGFLFAGAEAVITLFGIEFLKLPRWASALLVMFIFGGAFVTRFKSQTNMEDK